MPSPEPPSGVQDPRGLLVSTALSMRGHPYRFGGSTPSGFDCSGLVVYAAQGAGIPVPRTAADQWKTGVAVEREALQAGDLVFMRLNRELHVGIMTGPDSFVHAPSSGGQVRIDLLDSRPYRKGFIGGRRIAP